MLRMGLDASLFVASLKKVFKKKDYAFFDQNRKYNLNIVGIRNASRRANQFDDMLAIAYRGFNNAWEVRTYIITTDPGWTYLKNASERYSGRGTAILVPDQYRSTYKFGLHGSTKYEALVQSGDEVGVYRDKNKDNTLDFNRDTIEYGYFGINIHASSMYPYDLKLNTDRSEKKVNSWSAGCQVFARDVAFRNFMSLCKLSSQFFGDTFSYTLLEQKDFE
jgi:hypothetical protein